MARALPPNVSEFKDRHGKWRLRFRAKGLKPYYFKAGIGTDAFAKELAMCRNEAGRPVQPRTDMGKEGTISALIGHYYQRPEFLMLAASSKKSRRRLLERFRIEHGDKSVAGLKRRHIIAIQGAMSAHPDAANRVLDALRILMRVALDLEWRADDPTHGVTGLRYEVVGYHTWTEDEIEQFKAFYPQGTRQRLAFDLMLYTGQRRSDMVKMGSADIDGGRIRVKQLKTKKELWIPMHPHLATSIAKQGMGTQTILVTGFGKPFSSAGFGNRMRDWCNAAGLPHCASHGLRKAMARRLAEAGCTNAQIKAITGHETDAEVNRYIAEANQEALAEQAMARVETDQTANKAGP